MVETTLRPWGRAWDCLGVLIPSHGKDGGTKITRSTRVVYCIMFDLYLSAHSPHTFTFFFKQWTSLPLLLGQTLLCLQQQRKQFCSQELPICGGNKKINDKLINRMCGKRYKVKIMPREIIAGLIFYKISQCRNEARAGMGSPKCFKAKDSKIWLISSHWLNSNSTLPNPMKPHRYKDRSMRT